MDQSPFNKLSAELRNCIYDEVLASEKRSVVDINTKQAAQPAITRVCRQMRDETLLLFYSSGTFYAHLILDWKRSYSKYAVALNEWLLDTSAACHQSVPCLALTLQTGQSPMWWLEHDLRLLGKMLRHAGYQSHRLRTIVKIGNDHLRLHGGATGNKEWFKNIGFDITTLVLMGRDGQGEA